MTKEEILNYTEVGRTNSVCVNRILLDKYKNIVRDVIIKKDFKVQIEFNTYGYEEGGLVVDVYYENFDSLIYSIEDYFSLEISEWQNINKSGWYPTLEQGKDFSQGSKDF